MIAISQVDNIKIAGKTDSQSKSSYVTVCQICGRYRYSHEKIIVEFEDIHSEEEGGFEIEISSGSCSRIEKLKWEVREDE